MAIPKEKQNHVLGRGEVHFALFKPGTQEPDGYRYIGNTPEFNLTIETENLDHFDSDHGIREKDESIPLETNRTGSLITDNVNPANIALFFFGSTEVLAQAALATQVYTIVKPRPGHSYQIGEDRINPTGLGGLKDLVLKVGSTTLVEGTDYDVDLDTGLVTFASVTAAVTGLVDVAAAFDLRAMKRTQILSGTTPVEGAMLYKSFNPKGDRVDFKMPWVKLSPNGDYALKGDEWQQIPLTIEVLKRADMEAIYGNGRPVFTA